MNTKLTLTLEKDIIEHAKKYARDKGQSLSELVENYFKLLTENKSNETEIKLSPKVERLKGILKVDKDFDYKNVGVKKLFKLFKSSLIFDEAIDKIIWDKMDIENTQKILREIQNGDIDIHIQRLSPIALSGLETMKGLMVPLRADRSILMALKGRLFDINIKLVCTNCNKKWNTTVKRADFQPKCSNCGAIKIAVLRRYDKNSIKILTKKRVTSDENKEIKRLYKNASLVLTFGKFAMMTLMGRGIGPDTAARILRRYNRIELEKSDEIQLKHLRNILKAELKQ